MDIPDNEVEQGDNEEFDIDEFEEETFTIEDTDADYDQKKIDEAFPPQDTFKVPTGEEIAAGAPVERPPLVLQKLVVNFSNGRKGEFMGAAVMTVEEFRSGGAGRPASFDFEEPFVVAAENNLPDPANNPT